MARTAHSLTNLEEHSSTVRWLIYRPEKWLWLPNRVALRRRAAATAWVEEKSGRPVILIGHVGIFDLYFPRTKNLSLNWTSLKSRGRRIKSESHHRRDPWCVINSNGWVIAEACYVVDGELAQMCIDPGIADELYEAADRFLGGERQ